MLEDGEEVGNEGTEVGNAEEGIGKDGAEESKEEGIEEIEEREGTDFAKGEVLMERCGECEGGV